MVSRFVLSLFLKPLSLQHSGSRLFWQTAVALAGGVMTLTLACITPFAAMAVLAARTMSRRGAVVTLLFAVIANQVVGFGILGYPRTAASFVWGPVFFVATLLAHLVARRITQPVVALMSSFIAYEGVLAAYTFATERSLAAFSPPIVAQVAFANAVGFAVLGALYLGILAIERATYEREPTLSR
jgi:hypothetical protein